MNRMGVERMIDDGRTGLNGELRAYIDTTKSKDECCTKRSKCQIIRGKRIVEWEELRATSCRNLDAG